MSPLQRFKFVLEQSCSVIALHASLVAYEHERYLKRKYEPGNK